METCLYCGVLVVAEARSARLNCVIETCGLWAVRCRFRGASDIDSAVSCTPETSRDGDMVAFIHGGDTVLCRVAGFNILARISNSRNECISERARRLHDNDNNICVSNDTQVKICKSMLLLFEETYVRICSMSH